MGEGLAQKRQQHFHFLILMARLFNSKLAIRPTIKIDFGFDFDIPSFYFQPIIQLFLY